MLMAESDNKDLVRQGIKPIGKAIEVTAVNIDRVVDGCIVERGGAADLLDPLLKIGAVSRVTA